MCTHRFDPVPNAHDQFAFLPHGVDKLHWYHAQVVRLTELPGSTIQGSSKPVTLEQVTAI